MPENDGEKQGYREAMDRMTDELVRAGNTPERARQEAQEAALRADRRSRGLDNPRRERRE